MKKITKNIRGTTLIESLVAGIFLAVAIVGISTIVTHGSSINKEVMLRRRALQELERILESGEFSSRSYESLSGTGTLSSVTLNDKGSVVTSTPSYSVTSLTYSSGSVSSLPAKKIKLRMVWTLEGTSKDSVTLETVVTKVAVNN